MTTLAKAGTLISVEYGAYSDYSVIGFFVVLRDFDPAAKLEEYLAANPEQRTDYDFAQDQFLAALLAEGLLLEIQHGVLHLSSYGSVSEFRFTPAQSSDSGSE